MNELLARRNLYSPNRERDSLANRLDTRYAIVLNIALFQIAWIVCVIGGSRLALITTAACLVIHGFCIVRQYKEWLLIAVVALAGSMVDIVFNRLGVLLFPSETLLIPMWLACLWIVFATTLCHSLRWFHSRLVLAAIIGAIAGPFSYFAGARLSDVSLGQPLWQSLLLMSLWWMVFFPAILVLTRKVDHA